MVEGEMKIPEEVFNKFDDNLNVVDDKVEPEKANDKTPPASVKEPEVKKEPAKEPEPKVEDEPPVEQPKETEESEETSTPDESTDEKTLDEQIQEILQSYDTDEKKQQLLEDLPNHEKFFTSITNKSKKLSEELKVAEQQRDKFNAMLDKLSGDKVEEALESIVNDESLPDLLEQTDEWYGEENPLRVLIETLSSQPAKEMKAEIDALAEEKALIELEKEIVHIQGIDPRYNEEEELTKLAETAEAFNVNLEGAHKILVGEESIEKAKEYESKIAKLQEDLKKRNKEIKKLKEAPGYRPPEPPSNGKGSTHKVYEEPAMNDAELKRRMSEAWDENF